MNIGPILQLVLISFCTTVVKARDKAQPKIFDDGQECTLLLVEFAEASSDFMMCSISNARPIRMCSLCVEAYNGVIMGHKKFFESHNSLNETCKEKLINLDRLEIIEAGYSYVKDLWLKGRCRSCFTENVNVSLPITLSNKTKEFQKLYAVTNECLDKNYNETSQTYNPDVCNICSKQYCDMNSYYYSLKEELGDSKMCMDVVDTMNVTQNLWSDVLHCGETDMSTEPPLIACMTLFLFLPLLFYSSVYKFQIAPPSAVSQQKRLSQRLRDRWRSRTGSMISQFRG